MYKTSLGTTSEKAMAPTLVLLPGKSHGPRSLVAAVHGVAKSGTRLSVFTSLFSFMHWRRKWQPTPVLLPGESLGRGSLVGCCLWGRTESDTTERLSSSSRHNIPMIIWHSLCSLEVRRFTYIEEDKRVKERVLIEKKRGSWDGHKY